MALTFKTKAENVKCCPFLGQDAQQPTKGLFRYVNALAQAHTTTPIDEEYELLLRARRKLELGIKGQLQCHGGSTLVAELRQTAGFVQTFGIDQQDEILEKKVLGAKSGHHATFTVLAGRRLMGLYDKAFV